jgi:hypothetical protein
MIRKITLRGAASGIRRHPGWAVAAAGSLLAVSVLTGTSMASATPEPRLALSLAQLHAAPAPDINTNFASGLGGQVVKSHKGETNFKAFAGDDGCDHNYGNGNVGVCVPWVIPVPHGQACAFLLGNGYGALKVYGTDRQHLDTNHDGIACDSGDVGVK